VRIVRVFETLFPDMPSVQKDQDDEGAGEWNSVAMSACSACVLACLDLRSTKDDGQSLIIERIGRLLA